MRQRRHLALDVLLARGELLRQGPVVRRSASDRRRDQGAGQREAVAGMDRRGPVGQSDRVQGRKEEVSGSVSREHPTRPVASVRGRRETDDQDPSGRISERRHGPRPVGLTRETPGRMLRRFLPPRDEAGTAHAADHLAFDGVEGLH
jgi:hypothetical protein